MIMHSFGVLFYMKEIKTVRTWLNFEKKNFVYIVGTACVSNSVKRYELKNAKLSVLIMGYKVLCCLMLRYFLLFSGIWRYVALLSARCS